DLGLAFEAGAGRLIVVVDGIDVLLAAIIPPHRGVVDLAVNLHRDLLVALSGGGGLKFGNALLEVSATIAAEIGRLGRFANEDRPSHYASQGSDRHKAGGPVPSSGHNPPLLFETAASPVATQVPASKSYAKS